MIFLIAMGADYLFYVKIIEAHARAFLALIILAIGRVKGDRNSVKIQANIYDCLSILELKRLV